MVEARCWPGVRVQTLGVEKIPLVWGGSAKEVLLTIFQEKKKLNDLEVAKWRPAFFVAVPEALMSYCRLCSVFRKPLNN